MSEEQVPQETAQEEPAVVAVGFGGLSDTPIDTTAEATEQEPPAEGEATEAPTGAEGERLYAEKYKTVEELERGYKEAERMAQAKAQELARYAQDGSPQQQGTNPTAPNPLDLAPLLQKPPVTLFEDQKFIDFAQSQGIQWATDENGYIDTTAPANFLNLQFAREQLGGQVQQAYQAAEQQQLQATQAAELEEYQAELRKLELAEKTGIETPIAQNEVEDYLKIVLKPVNS